MMSRGRVSGMETREMGRVSITERAEGFELSDIIRHAF